jgi:hypothetical protein
MLVVADVGRSAAFYRDRLGFEVREQQPDLALLALGPMLLYLVTHSDPTPDKPGVTLACINDPQRTSVNLVFRVADCRAAYDTLTRRGGGLSGAAAAAAVGRLAMLYPRPGWLPHRDRAALIHTRAAGPGRPGKTGEPAAVICRR